MAIHKFRYLNAILCGQRDGHPYITPNASDVFLHTYWSTVGICYTRFYTLYKSEQISFNWSV